MISWIFLMIAGFLEVTWTYFLKESMGFSRLGPSLLFAVTLAASMIFLALAVKTIPVGVAYPIWTGIGAVGAVLIGALVFGEVMSLPKAFFVLMIIGGIIGLKLSTAPTV